MTPVVNTIDTSNPSSIKLIGLGFDSTNISNNQLLAQRFIVHQVWLSEHWCNLIFSSTLTWIKGQGQVGTYNFSVNVYPNGLAQMNSASIFTFSLNASSVNPTSSGTGGI